MFDGLRPDTCIVIADNARLDGTGDRTLQFDLIEFRCDGPGRRVETRRRVIDLSDTYGIEHHILHNSLDLVNRKLRQRAGCECADDYRPEQHYLI